MNISESWQKLISLFLSTVLILDPCDYFFQDSILHADIQANALSQSKSFQVYDFTDISLDGLQKENSYSGQSSFHIILIRDLHCQEEAQLRIAHGIKELHEKWKIKQIFLEGAAENVRDYLYDSFPDSEIRKQVARQFVKEGYLTGAEYAIIEMGSESGLSLFGVEDMDLYLRSFAAYREVRKQFSSLKPELDHAEEHLNEIQSSRFSSKLKELNGLFETLQEPSANLYQLFTGFEKAVQSTLFYNPQDWPGLSNLSRVMKNMNELDQTKVRDELNRLTAWLQANLVQENYKELAEKMLQYRIAKISTSEYLSSLKKLYENKNTGKTFNEEYEGLSKWKDISEEQEKIDISSRIEEMERALRAIRQHMAAEEKAEDLLLFTEKWSLAKRLMTLSLSRKDVEVLLKFKSEGLLNSFFAEISTPSFEKSSLFPQPDQASELLNLSWLFYELALQRDHVMADKTLQKLENSEEKAGILITGGFHTSGIEKILESRGVSYETWSPVIGGKSDQALYEKIMLDPTYELKPEYLSRDISILTGNFNSGKMLSAPVLLSSILETVGGQDTLNQHRIKLLKEMIRQKTEKDDLNRLLNEWMDSEKNRDILKNLKEDDFRLLFEALSDREDVFLNLSKFKTDIPVQAELAIKYVKEVYENEFPALARMTEVYFQTLAQDALAQAPGVVTRHSIGRHGLSAADLNEQRPLLNGAFNFWPEVQSKLFDMAQKLRREAEEEYRNFLKQDTGAMADSRAADMIQKQQASIQKILDLYGNVGRLLNGESVSSLFQNTKIKVQLKVVNTSQLGFEKVGHEGQSSYAVSERGESSTGNEIPYTIYMTQGLINHFATFNTEVSPEKGYHLLLSLLGHEMSELLGLTHLEAVQQESLFDENFKARSLARQWLSGQSFDAVLSDLSLWDMEQAAERKDVQHLSKLKEPYRLSAENEALVERGWLSREATSRAYALSGRVAETASQKLDAIKTEAKKLVVLQSAEERAVLQDLVRINMAFARSIHEDRHSIPDIQKEFQKIIERVLLLNPGFITQAGRKSIVNLITAGFENYMGSSDDRRKADLNEVLQTVESILNRWDDIPEKEIFQGLKNAVDLARKLDLLGKMSGPVQGNIQGQSHFINQIHKQVKNVLTYYLSRSNEKESGAQMGIARTLNKYISCLDHFRSMLNPRILADLHLDLEGFLYSVYESTADLDTRTFLYQTLLVARQKTNDVKLAETLSDAMRPDIKFQDYPDEFKSLAVFENGTFTEVNEQYAAENKENIKSFEKEWAEIFKLLGEFAGKKDRPGLSVDRIQKVRFGKMTSLGQLDEKGNICLNEMLLSYPGLALLVISSVLRESSLNLTGVQGRILADIFEVQSYMDLPGNYRMQVNSGLEQFVKQLEAETSQMSEQQKGTKARINNYAAQLKEYSSYLKNAFESQDSLPLITKWIIDHPIRSRLDYSSEVSTLRRQSKLSQELTELYYLYITGEDLALALFNSTVKRGVSSGFLDSFWAYMANSEIQSLAVSYRQNVQLVQRKGMANVLSRITDISIAGYALQYINNLMRSPETKERYEKLRELRQTIFVRSKEIAGEGVLIGESRRFSAGARKNIIKSHPELSANQLLQLLDLAQTEPCETRTSSADASITYKLIEFTPTDEIGKILNNVEGAYHLTDANTGTNYIFVQKDLEDRDAAIEHEELEIYWNNKLEEIENAARAKGEETLWEAEGRTRTEAAHILAWGSQIINRSLDEINNNDFVSRQVAGLEIEGLFQILSENRDFHSKLLKQYLPVDGNELQRIYRFEESVRSFAEKRLNETVTKEDKLIEYSHSFDREDAHAARLQSVEKLVVIGRAFLNQDVGREPAQALYDLYKRALAYRQEEWKALHEALNADKTVSKAESDRMDQGMAVRWNAIRHLDVLVDLALYLDDSGRLIINEVLPLFESAMSDHPDVQIGAIHALHSLAGALLKLDPSGRLFEERWPPLYQKALASETWKVRSQGPYQLSAVARIMLGKDPSGELLKKYIFPLYEEAINASDRGFFVAQAALKDLTDLGNILLLSNQRGLLQEFIIPLCQTGIERNEPSIKRAGLEAQSKLDEIRAQKETAGGGARKTLMDAHPALAQDLLTALLTAVESRKGETRALAQDEGITYKLVEYAPNDSIGITLGTIGGAYHLSDEKTGKNYVLIEKGVSDREVAIEHEELELAWRRKLQGESLPEGMTSDRAAHILAWGEQILKKGLKGDYGLFLKEQIKKMSLTEISDFIAEDRKAHHQLIQTYLGVDAAKEVVKVEANVSIFALNQLNQKVASAWRPDEISSDISRKLLSFLHKEGMPRRESSKAVLKTMTFLFHRELLPVDEHTLEIFADLLDRKDMLNEYYDEIVRILSPFLRQFMNTCELEIDDRKFVNISRKNIKILLRILDQKYAGDRVHSRAIQLLNMFVKANVFLFGGLELKVIAPVAAYLANTDNPSMIVTTVDIISHFRFAMIKPEYLQGLLHALTRSGLPVSTYKSLFMTLRAVFHDRSNLFDENLVRALRKFLIVNGDSLRENVPLYIEAMEFIEAVIKNRGELIQGGFPDSFIYLWEDFLSSGFFSHDIYHHAFEYAPIGFSKGYFHNSEAEHFFQVFEDIVGNFPQLMNSRFVKFFESIYRTEGLHPYVYSAAGRILKAIYEKRSDLRKPGSISEVIASFPETALGHSLIHYKIWTNQFFRNLAREETFASQYSIALASHRLLLRFGLDPSNSDNIDKALYFITNRRRQVADAEILGPNTYVINILHQEERFKSEDLERIAEASGVMPGNVSRPFKGEADKQEALANIKNVRGKLTIVFSGHGGKNHVWMDHGTVGVHESDQMKRRDAISYVELGNVLVGRAKRGERLDNVTLLIDACYAFNFAENLLSYLSGELKKIGKESVGLPVMITSNNFDRLGYGGLVSALSERNQAGQPLKMKDIFDVENEAFNMHDFGIMYSIDTARVAKLFNVQVPEDKGADVAQPVAAAGNAFLSEHRMSKPARLPLGIFEIGSVFYPYYLETARPSLIHRIFSFLGNPLVSPVWEEGVFRLGALGAAGVTLQGLFALSPMAWGMFLGVSAGLFSAAHVIVRWLKDREKPFGLRTYKTFSSILKDFISFSTVSLSLSSVYILTGLFLNPFSLIGIAIPFVISVLLHLVMNILVGEAKQNRFGKVPSKTAEGKNTKRKINADSTSLDILAQNFIAGKLTEEQAFESILRHKDFDGAYRKIGSIFLNRIRTGSRLDISTVEKMVRSLENAPDNLSDEKNYFILNLLINYALFGEIYKTDWTKNRLDNITIENIERLRSILNDDAWRQKVPPALLRLLTFHLEARIRNIGVHVPIPDQAVPTLLEAIQFFPSELSRNRKTFLRFGDKVEEAESKNTAGHSRGPDGFGVQFSSSSHDLNLKTGHLRLVQTFFHEILHEISLDLNSDGQPVLSAVQWGELARMSGFTHYLNEEGAVIPVDELAFYSIQNGKWERSEKPVMTAEMIDQMPDNGRWIRVEEGRNVIYMSEENYLYCKARLSIDNAVKKAEPDEVKSLEDQKRTLLSRKINEKRETLYQNFLKAGIDFNQVKIDADERTHWKLNPFEVLAVAGAEYLIDSKKVEKKVPVEERVFRIRNREDEKYLASVVDFLRKRFFLMKDANGKTVTIEFNFKKRKISLSSQTSNLQSAALAKEKKPAGTAAQAVLTATSYGNLSASWTGNVSGDQGITNIEVNEQLKNALSSMQPDKTYLNGAVLAFKPGSQTVKERDSFVDQLNEFMKSDMYLALDENTRKLFEDTRLVIFKDKVNIAENDKGASYAHYGQAEIPTIFIGGKLLEAMLQNRKKWEALASLIKIEINRRMHREKNPDDLRTSNQVLKDVFPENRVGSKILRDLTQIIAETEARILIEKHGADRIEETILAIADQMTNTNGQSLQIDSIILRKLKGQILEEVVNLLAEVKKNADQERLKESGRRIQTQETAEVSSRLADLVVKGIESMRKNHGEVANAALNFWSGEATLFFENGHSESVSLNQDALNAFVKLAERKTGDTEWILLDLKRGLENADIASFVRNGLESLTQGESLPPGHQERTLADLSLESLNVKGTQLIYISKGKKSFEQIEESAQKIGQGRKYFEAGIKQNIPVAVEKEVLMQMSEAERLILIRKLINELAIVEGALIEGLTQQEQARLAENWKKFTGLDSDHQVAIVLGGSDRQMPKIQNASLLPVGKGQIGYINDVVLLGRYVANVGKNAAKLDPQATAMLRQILRELFDEGQITEQELDGVSFQSILENPEKFLLPPIKTNNAADLESYFRVQHAVETMA